MKEIRAKRRVSDGERNYGWQWEQATQLNEDTVSKNAQVSTQGGQDHWGSLRTAVKSQPVLLFLSASEATLLKPTGLLSQSLASSFRHLHAQLTSLSLRLVSPDRLSHFLMR